jgi:hypothetical protein
MSLKPPIFFKTNREPQTTPIMKFIAKRLNLIGILLLFTFAAAAAGLYFDVPTRMQKPKAKAPPPALQSAVAGSYVCPMHPEVTSTHPDKCRECLMALVPASAEPSRMAGCGGQQDHGCCAGKENKEDSAQTLPPGHPPVPGYTVQSGCEHDHGNTAAPPKE